MSKRLKKTGKSAARSRRKFLTIVVAAVVLAIGAVTVISRQRGNAEQSSPEVTSAANKTVTTKAAANRSYVTVKVAGQEVQVDSQTGQIKPLTPEEAQKMAAGLRQEINQTTDGLVQVQHADGSVSMDLDGHFRNVTVARRNDDGSVSESCVDNAQSAGEFFGIDPQLIENRQNTSAVSQPRPRVAPVKKESQ